MDSEPEQFIRGEVVVDAPREAVWDAWTTAAGVRSFFAPDCRVELEPMGAYETYFDLDAEPGRRGGEGNRVLAVQQPSMLSFTWNAPPDLPDVREHRTVVVVRFDALDDRRTRVSLTHLGWGTGGQWDEAFAYFEAAWNDVVLPRLVARFDDGPIDWHDEG